MTNILSRTKLLLALCLVITLGFLYSCKKDTVANSGKVELLSFGPTGAKHGENMIFIGNNLNKVTSIELAGATIPSSAFTEWTAEKIVFVIPATAVQGYATLKTSEGDVVSKTKVNFEVPVKITSMTAKARPGENITIKGEFLNWVREIKFAKDIAETTFVSQSINEIVVKIPENAESGTLLISTAGTKPLSIETDSTLLVTLPAITSVTPNPVLHAANLSIKGTDLDLVKQVLFNGVTEPQTTFVSQSPTEIVVKVPGGAQKGKVTVAAASGIKVLSASDLDVLLPAVTAIAPNPVDVLANLTITGTNLNLVTGVSFIGASSVVTSFVSQSATQLVVKVPTGTLKGKLTLSVLNSSLTVTTDQVLDLNGGLPPLADFPYAIYTDALQNGFQDWSWAARDFNSTAIVRQGTTSIKATYGTGGYEGITFHSDAGIATGSYSKIEFSFFGAPGTGGKTMNVVVNGNWGTPNTVTINEGEWTTYTVNLSSINGYNGVLKEMVLQSAGFSGVIYIDHVGLR